MMYLSGILVTAGSCFLLGYITCMPYAYRLRWYQRKLAETRHARGIRKLVDTGELSWSYIKEHAAYAYTYLPPGHGKHSLTLKRRLMLWWAQTAPRDRERWVKLRVTS